MSTTSEGDFVNAERQCIFSDKAIFKERVVELVPREKLTGLYLTNALAKTEAIENGYDEAIMLTPEGYVAEGSGENIFLIRGGKMITPAEYAAMLMGTTRATTMELAKAELGLETVERHVNRIELYSADEIFLTGTAAHITPVAAIDGRQVGNGKPGKITTKLQHIHSDVIKGNNSKYSDWCTPAYKH